MNATSWTVTTWGAEVAAGIAVVEWHTSIGPVAASTLGRSNRFHVSYNHGRASGSDRTLSEGRYGGDGCRR